MSLRNLIEESRAILAEDSHVLPTGTEVEVQVVKGPWWKGMKKGVVMVTKNEGHPGGRLTLLEKGSAQNLIDMIISPKADFTKDFAVRAASGVMAILFLRAR